MLALLAQHNVSDLTSRRQQAPALVARLPTGKAALSGSYEIRSHLT